MKNKGYANGHVVKSSETNSGFEKHTVSVQRGPWTIEKKIVVKNLQSTEAKQRVKLKEIVKL